MGGDRRGAAFRSSAFAADLLDSAEFAVAFVSVMTLVGLGVPLLLTCYRHLAAGHVALGCSFGVFGVAVTGVSGWKLLSSVRRIRTKRAASGVVDPVEPEPPARPPGR